MSPACNDTIPLLKRIVSDAEEEEEEDGEDVEMEADAEEQGDGGEATEKVLKQQHSVQRNYPGTFRNSSL